MKLNNPGLIFGSLKMQKLGWESTRRDLEE